MGIDIKFTSYIFSGDKKTCSGCSTCVQICVKKALVMQPDEEGFLYPVLNTDLCIQCGLCDSRCPEFLDKSNVGNDQHCYIATTDVANYYKESASIGICTMLADYVVKQGGIVYGCYLDENDWTAYHIGVTDHLGVQRIRNSKYLQSNTKTTFSEVKHNLKEGKMVLYIGTPCQVAGLKSYLKNDFDNLYTIDLICHGVFSPKLMPLEVSYWEKLFGARIHNFKFRSKRIYKHKNGGMVNFDIVKTNGKTKHIERFAGSSPTYHCFAYSGDGMNYNLRLSCYDCPFKSDSRYGDITVGDPWFINESIIKDSRLDSINTIRSLYSSNTSKGRLLIDNIRHNLYEKEYANKDTFVQPAVLHKQREVPYNRHRIYEQINTQDYGPLVERIFNCNLEKEHRKFVRNYYFFTAKKFFKSLFLYKLWKK